MLECIQFQILKILRILSQKIKFRLREVNKQLYHNYIKLLIYVMGLVGQPFQIFLLFLKLMQQAESVLMDGANYCNPIQNENYMLISSIDYGMITLVNIQNKTKPIVYSKYIQDEQQSFGNCYLSNYSYGFSVSQFGLRVFPIKSKIKIHSSIVDISDNGSPKRLIQNELLQVGQIKELQLLMFYSTQGSQITSVFYYENYQMNQLPYWITFIKSSNSVIITVDKSLIVSAA
ncbi:hypothetical protein ABPG72_017393 [Tetrahymena utriculariae]